MTEGERVKAIRKAKALTLEKFGDQLGVTKVTISRLENGDRGITDQMCRSICREFGVSETWLRTGEGEMFLHETSNEVEALAQKYDLSPKSKALVEQFVTLRPEIQDGIIDFIESAAAAFAQLDETETDEERHERHKREAREEAERYYQELLEQKRAEEDPETSETAPGLLA